LVCASAYTHQATLRQAAQSKGIFIGAIRNYQLSQNQSDPQYTQVLNQQYSLSTAENDCKWGSIQPNRGQFDFSKCTAMANAAFAAGEVFRGHNLCWGQGNPNWLQNGHFPADQLRTILQTPVQTVVSQYKGKFYCWDVVNEAVSDSPSGNNILKNTLWYPAVPDFIDVAFKAARAADPAVKLFYNDYSGEGSGAKSDAIYNLVKSMKSRGIPIDGVGLQMHVSVNYFPTQEQVSANIKRLGDLGLEVHVTEMDVSCPPPCDANALAKQATIYSQMLSACLANSNCKSFQTWGHTDLHSWLNNNGVNNKPLPFDVNYNKKPAFDSLLATLQK